MAIPKLLTITEVAALARAPVSTVSYWIYCGRLRARKIGRRRLIAESDLLKFLEGDAQPWRSRR